MCYKRCTVPQNLHLCFELLRCCLWSIRPVPLSGVIFTSPLIGAIAKLRKTIIGFVTTVCLCVRMKKFGSNWTDFHKLWYLKIFRKSDEKIPILIKIWQKYRLIYTKTMYFYDNIALSSSKNEKWFKYIYIIYNKSTRCNSGSIVFIKNYKYVLHVSGALCVHHQEHYKL